MTNSFNINYGYIVKLYSHFVYSPLNSYVYIHWILDFKYILYYVDLQYDEISLTFTAGYVCLCGVSSPVIVLGLFVRLS